MAANPTAGYHPVSVIAAICELDPRRIQQLAKQGIIPKAKRGEYHLVESVRAYIRYLRSGQTPGSGEPTTQMDLQKLRILRAQARMAELELGQAEGALVSASRFTDGLMRAFSRVREKLVALPPRVAPELLHLDDEAAAESIVQRYVLEAMDELRNEEIPEDEPEVGESAA